MATIQLFNDWDSWAVARWKINTSLTNLNNDKIEASDIANFETTTQLNARDTANRNRANHTWTQLASTISDFDTEVSNNTDVSANTSARHTHSNKSLLDTYTQTEVDLADAVTKKHTHSNKTILDNTTASFTTADEIKLDWIEAWAEVNTLNDVIAWTNITIDKTDPLNPIINSTGGGWWATALDDLTDVTITTPANWQALTYNGTQWVNSTPAWWWDMLKSVYDTNDDWIVNQADVITNQWDLATLDSVNTAQITNWAVENTKLANMNANTVKGRLSWNWTPQDIAMADLPISTATQTALNWKANLTWATFTWTITATNLSWTNTWDQDLSWKQNILSEWAFVNWDKTKLDWIEAWAEVNTINAWDNISELTNNVWYVTNWWLVWTKVVDETAIWNDKILVYKTASWELEYENKPTWWGGWNIDIVLWVRSFATTSWDVTYTHSLWTTPTHIEVISTWVLVQGSAAYSTFSFWDYLSWNKSIWNSTRVGSTSRLAWNSTTYAIYNITADWLYTQLWAISNITSTDFTITWTSSPWTTTWDLYLKFTLK